jgi:hypothetical protein
MHTFPFMNCFVINMCLWCYFLCVDCAECNECLCDECTNSSPHQGKCHHIPSPTESFVTCSFLVEDACVGDFMSLCLWLARFYAKSFV